MNCKPLISMKYHCWQLYCMEGKFPPKMFVKLQHRASFNNQAVLLAYIIAWNIYMITQHSSQQIQNELQTVINRLLTCAAYMYWCNIPIRDGQLGLIRQITWHQNLNTAVSGFYHDRAFWSLLGDTAMLEWWIRLFMLRVTCVCQDIDGVVWWTLLIGVVVATVIRFLIRSSTHISGWLYITV